MNFPRMYRVRQVFDAPRIDDIEKTMLRELEAIDYRALVKDGARIAITAGSRGIANIDRILKHLVALLKERGAEPFLIPAMGSHGGGTAEGQTVWYWGR